jgi:hypothetical protein
VLVNKLQEPAQRHHHTNAQTTEITGDGKVNGLKYKDRATGEEHLVPLEGVFVQIGLVPNTEWLKGTVELSEVRRDRDRRQGPHQRARRVCRRRLHHGAVQADRDRRRRRRQGRAERVRPPDPHARSPSWGPKGLQLASQTQDR